MQTQSKALKVAEAIENFVTTVFKYTVVVGVCAVIYAVYMNHSQLDPTPTQRIEFNHTVVVPAPESDSDLSTEWVQPGN